MKAKIDAWKDAIRDTDFLLVDTSQREALSKFVPSASYPLLLAGYQ